MKHSGAIKIRLITLMASALLTLTACAEDGEKAGGLQAEGLKSEAVSAENSASSSHSQNTAKPVNLLEKYQEGVHYFAIEPAVATDDPNKIEVAEMFWYGCSHCFAFEPALNEWKAKLADDIHFVRVPAMWNPIMEAHARLFYTTEKHGILEDAHQAIFNEIHINGKRLDKTEDIANLLEKFGADKKAVINDLSSFEITNQVKQADTRARSYKIGGVPNLVVEGRYRVESNQNLRQSQMLDVVDFLVKKSRVAKK